MAVERIIHFSRTIEVPVPREKLIPGTRLYMASPNGFMPDAEDFHESMCELITAMGGEPLNPWQQKDPNHQARLDAVMAMPEGSTERTTEFREEVNPMLTQANEDAIDIAHGLIANLNGTDVDSGVSNEIGIAYKAAKLLRVRRPIIGYRGDFRRIGDNEGCIVNIQVEHAIYGSGGTIIRDVRNLPSVLIALFGEDAA